MNLLLLLSALLSALTGLSTSVARPAAVVAASAQVTRHVSVAALPQATRPADQPFALAQSARAPVVSPIVLRPIAPLFASRRRE